MQFRLIEQLILDDLNRKMVFIGGPRQVGKTTLARSFEKRFKNSTYLNWDQPKHKIQILNQRWNPDSEIIIFDEIHKYPQWKSLIKGIWDTRKQGLKIIVTGSSKLNIFRKGGDSLLGRYHYYTLSPFSLGELIKKSPPDFTNIKPEWSFKEYPDIFDKLFKFGGFPETYLSSNVRTLKRWHKERFERIFREDIRDYENIRSLSMIELLGQMLPGRIGSSLSYRSLSEDLNVSYTSIQKWIELLIKNYYIFRIYPYSHHLKRAIKKENKVYLWDWSEIPDESIRFENMIASHLLKYCLYYQEAHGILCELWTLRDREKREVDFLLTWEKSPWCLIECKLKYKKVPQQLNYFGEKLKVHHKYLITMDTDNNFMDQKTKTRVIPACIFLSALV